MPTFSAVRRPARTSLVSAAALAAVLLAGGCSDDDPSPDPSGPSSAGSDVASSAAVDTLVEKGLKQLTAGKERSAKNTFENVLVIDPDNIYALYNLGLIAQRAGNDDAAIEMYNQALVVAPDYTPALYNKAILYESRDLDEAIQLYRQVISADDTVAAAYMRLGFALVHQGKTEEGADFLEQGIALDPAMADIDAPTYE